MTGAATGPLAGLAVLDISTVIAGPFAAALLGDLGAEVLKVELPGVGDALRGLPPHKDGVPLWWKVTNRNKEGIALDLRKPAGRAVFERLLPRYQVLVENFRPGTLDRWGLPASRLFQLNPKLTVLRVTGFGQTGPDRNRTGFARIFEAMSGFTHLCGEADGPPLHVGFPIADAVAGLFGAMAILAALYDRHARPEAPGQEIDLSLVEAMLRVLDFLPIEHDQLGTVRSRGGNFSQYAAPGNVYRTRDGRWITLTSATESVWRRIARALGRPELIDDPRFRDNRSRVAHREALDPIIAAEVAARTMEELRQVFEAHEVSWSPIYTIADIFADPHLQARGALARVADPDLGSVVMQQVVPRFSGTPAEVRSTGPALGQHTRGILRDRLGMSEAEIAALARDGVI